MTIHVVIEYLILCTFVEQCLRDLAAMKGEREFPMKTLIVVFSYHHSNTQKVAEVFAKVLDAQIKTPKQINPEELQDYDLVGFGSGIDTGKNYKELLDFAERLPQVIGKKAFVFSTSGMPIGVSGQQRLEEYTSKCHTTLKETLQSKGYTIVDEFGCAGFNTNKFLKYFGGLNKGRPNEEDLKHAEAFAEKLKV
jgi:flavodoxin